MLRSNKLIIPVILATLLSCNLLAHADTLVPPAGTGSTDVLTDDTLLQMLRGLGYDPKIESYSNGAKGYTVRLKQDGWDFVFTVQLSPDKTVVWISAYLGRVPAGNKVLPEALLNLLELNSRNGKGKFVTSANGHLYLQMPVDNRGVTPSLLRGALEMMATVTKSTADGWNTSAWTAEGKEAGAFRAKVDGLYGKVREAYAEFVQALTPVVNGGLVDTERLKRAHARLLQTVREVRESMKGLNVPTSETARALVDAYLRVLDTDEVCYTNELAEIVRLVEDNKISSSDRLAKVKELSDKMTKKQQAAFEGLQVAVGNFRKQYEGA